MTDPTDFAVMNPIDHWVRSTIDDAARESYEGNLYDAMCDACKGTDTGWWNTLIYNRDVDDMAKHHMDDIASWLDDMIDEGCGPYPAVALDGEVFRNLIRAAVEWYAFEYARECFPESF